jgi:hypothetical protein
MDEVARVLLLEMLEVQVFVVVDLLIAQPRGEAETSYDMVPRLAIPVEWRNRAEAQAPEKYSG